MAVRIRLTRVGATKRPAYRVIAIDKRRSRDGRALEILGFYDPLTEPATVQLDTEKINRWIGQGAQPSDTVMKLMRQAEREASAAKAGTEAEKPKRATRSAKPKPSKKAAARTESPAAEPAPDEVAPAAPDGATASLEEAPAPTDETEKADA